MDIVRENGLEKTITLLKGRLEDIHELNGRRFDVIVSEWMGYFLLFEGMLDSVIAARKRHLMEGGRLLPNRYMSSRWFESWTYSLSLTIILVPNILHFPTPP